MNPHFHRKQELPDAASAIPGRTTPLATAETHFVNGRPLKGGIPAGFETVFFGMGCFWGAERLLWELDGVWVTSVGYAGGLTLNPTYEETCTGQTGHTEVVQVVFDPAAIAFADLLKAFWENHDPTQGMRQGNDLGTQYRSAIYTTGDAQAEVTLASLQIYNERLAESGHGAITTEIGPMGVYYYAEEYHQQYLAKNPGGYCNIGGTGVSCPAGLQD